jgi:class 3 adenylate cyclase
VQCPDCGFDSSPEMNYCGMCGRRLRVVCPNCGLANPSNYVFCGHCGRQLAQDHTPEEVDRAEGTSDVSRPSPAAAALPPAVESVSVQAESTIEPLLDRQVAPLEGERRLATVILVDVQGSTNLLERMGTEAWVKMMNQVFQILESEIYRFGGQVDQFRGDGLVAFFGTRAAHEDDPERAILAALALQEAVRPYAGALSEQQGVELRLRVGVNTGEVIVANIGDRRRYSEDTAMGEAIALAARMETAAAPGTVLVSENTYHLAEAQFHWEALGELSVKGISQPVAVYRPLGLRADVQRSRRLESYQLASLLVGRDEPWSDLMKAVNELRAGRGSIVTLTGDEGMGKSHLVAQVRQHVLRDEALLAEAYGEKRSAESGSLPVSVWLRGRCRSYGQSWPYSMWGDLMRHWLGVAGEESESEVRDRCYQQVQALWGERADQRYACIATMFSWPIKKEIAGWVARLDAEGLREQLFTTVSSWIASLAQRGPLVIVFEDVHWADTASVELLKYSLVLCERLPVLWLILSRMQRDLPVRDLLHYLETEYPHRLTSLTLKPLTLAQSGEMIDRLIGPDVLPQETRALIIERAEGNPYYIEELIRSLVQAGTLVRDARVAEWRLARSVGSLDLPDTLRSLLLARIDDLGSQERLVLQLAAVIGVVFWEHVLQELVPDDIPLQVHLSTLQRAQLIAESQRVADLGMEYVFRSALIRDVAYDSILSAKQAAYHRQVADHLSQLFGRESLEQRYGVVAYHYRRAGERRKELFYTLSAAEQAQQIYANAEALEFYARALELLDELEVQSSSMEGLELDWRLEALRGMGQVRFGSGQVVESEEYFRQAIALGRQMGLASRELVRLF